MPEALALESNASIRGFYRMVLRATDARSAGMQCGAKEFKETVHKWPTNMLLVAP